MGPTAAPTVVAVSTIEPITAKLTCFQLPTMTSSLALFVVPLVGGMSYLYQDPCQARETAENCLFFAISTES
jgi:hypothetical protein